MKKENDPPRVKCSDCTYGSPHKGLAVLCSRLDVGRVANAIRKCNSFKRK